MIDFQVNYWRDDISSLNTCFSQSHDKCSLRLAFMLCMNTPGIHMHDCRISLSPNAISPVKGGKDFSFLSITHSVSLHISNVTLTGFESSLDFQFHLHIWEFLSEQGKHAAIYCSDEELERQAVAVGKFTGDVTFPIIYCPEIFRGEFSSQVADMKNSASDRTNALSSCAGQFIGNHIEEFLSDSVGGKWLHIDMAGPGHIGERATGYGVALLFGLVSEISV
eukprot:gene6509-13144_t